MKTALTIVTATIVPGGFIILAIGFAAYLLARHRKAKTVTAAPALG
jgi:hypothetical protein